MREKAFDQTTGFGDIDGIVEDKQAELLERAMRLCSRFYDEKSRQAARAKATKNYSLNGTLGCRAKIQKGGKGIIIEWFHQTYVGPKGNRRAFSKSIPKGRTTNEYSRGKVVPSTAQEWEGRMFDELEPEFAKLRAASKALGKLSRQAHEARKKWLLLEDD